MFGAQSVAAASTLESEIESIRSDYDLNGVSLAIAREDPNSWGSVPTVEKDLQIGESDPDSGDPVDPSHRFRLGSISKTLTATGIMKLYEDGDLDLDRQVFPTGQSCFSCGTEEDPIFDSSNGELDYATFYFTEVEVRHLLDHTSGFEGDNGDIVYDDDGLPEDCHHSQDDVMEHLLDNFTVTTPPGDDYDYQNINYFVLGRVIEEVTGEDYTTWMKDDVLSYAAADEMDTYEMLDADEDGWEKMDNEVEYHEYINYYACQETMGRRDAHGGWIASPGTAAQEFWRIFNPNTITGPLDDSTVDEMTERQGDNSDYAYGVRHYDNAGNPIGHSGKSPGGFAAMRYRTEDDYCFVITVNDDTDKHGDARDELVDATHSFIDTVL